MNQKFVRIVAIVLAVIIAGGVFVGALTSVLAADASAAVVSSTPATNDNGVSVLPVIIGLASVLIISACIITPKLSKK